MSETNENPSAAAVGSNRLLADFKRQVEIMEYLIEHSGPSEV